MKVTTVEHVLSGNPRGMTGWQLNMQGGRLTQVPQIRGIMIHSTDSLFWLAESVQWIFEISAWEVIKLQIIQNTKGHG